MTKKRNKNKDKVAKEQLTFAEDVAEDVLEWAELYEVKDAFTFSD